MSGFVGPYRLWQGTPGASSIRNLWGGFLNDNANLVQQGTTGYVAVNINGLTTYTLTALNGTSDQSRPSMIDFTGALAANCAVTIPNVARWGWVRNSTTGSRNVFLNSGGGADATVPPTGGWYLYFSDGAGTCSVLNAGFNVVYAANGLTVAAGGITVTGTSLVTGTFGVIGSIALTGPLTMTGTLNLTGFLGVSNGITVSGGGFAATMGSNTMQITGSAFRAGLGYQTRAGAGLYGANVYNIDWSGSQATLYIDSTPVGVIQFVSDRRIKRNVRNIDASKARDRVMRLRPVSYEMANVGIFGSDGIQRVGFIADEVQSIVPSAVNGAPGATKDGGIVPQTLNPLPLIAELTAAVQSLAAEFAEYKRTHP